MAVALTERAMPIARSFDEVTSYLMKHDHDYDDDVRIYIYIYSGDVIIQIQDIAQIHETATAQLVALRALNIIA